MSFLNPIYFLLSFLIVPIIILHLLKKDYKKREVSSLFLWDETLKNIQVDKSFQKIKKWLLLILQILIILSLIMFLVKPYIKGEQSEKVAYILVDNSVSMEENLEKVKNDVTKLVNDLSKDTLINLYEYNSKSYHIKSSFSKKDIIDSIKKDINLSLDVDNLGFVLDENDFSDGNIYVFSDSKVSFKSDNIFYKEYENAKNDIYIDNINYKINENKKVDLAVRINNLSSQKKSVDLSLYSNGEISNVREIVVDKESIKTYFFKDIDNLKFGKVEIDIDDKNQINNKRYFAINEETKNKVLLISDNNLFLEKALSNLDNIELYKTKDKLSKLEGYDLYVIDSIDNDFEVKSGNILVFNTEINNLIKFEEKNISGNLKIVKDDLFKYLNEKFYISKSNTFVLEENNKIIGYMDNKPIIIKGIKDDIRYIALGFNIYNSDFPVKPDFPVFISQSIDYLLKDKVDFKSNILVNEMININNKYKTTMPNGKKVKNQVKANDIGIYLLEDDENSYYLSANIDTKEYSKNTKSIKKEINNTIKVKREKKDISKIFLFLALVFLVIEWLVYKYEK